MRRGRPAADGALPAARHAADLATHAAHAAGSAWRLHARLCRPADRRGLDRYVSMDGCAPR
ncbi:hypothetical protein C6T52_29415 [Burkholderia multivorans]|nr:hypothetical protein C6T52_29415 [Burkholderia multivorans]